MHNADIEQRGSFKFDSVEVFVKQFPCLQHLDLDELEIEFNKYEVDKCIELDPTCPDISKQWIGINSIKDITSGQSKYGNLFQIIQAILSIPHANTEPERNKKCYNFPTKSWIW